MQNNSVGRPAYGMYLVIAIMAASGLIRPAQGAGPVGNGSPGTCTEAALDAALVGGGLVNFDCGAAPATITFSNTKTISTNTTINGGGLITLSGGDAVGLFDVDPGISFTVFDINLVDGHRTAVNDGGAAIKLGTIGNGATLSLTRATLSGHHVDAAGAGAIAVFGASNVTIDSSTFTDNHASSQGAVMAAAITSTVNITNSTFTGNGNIGGANGCIDTSGTLNITNSTIANNTSDLGNPALSAFGDGAVITLRDTIVANNTNGNCDTFVGGQIVDGGNNLQYPDDSCGATIPVADPRLAPLADNGGPTQTMALLPGSPAIDQGNDGVAPPVDQRGVARADGDGNGTVVSDIGAYEAAAFSALVRSVPAVGPWALILLASMLAIAALRLLGQRIKG